MMLFLFGLYEQLNSHFLLWKFTSIYEPSIGLVSVDKNLAGISSLIKTIIPSPCWSRSRCKGEAYPGIQNWLTGKDSSSLVSEITNTSVIPFDLFNKQIKFISYWVNIKLSYKNISKVFLSIIFQIFFSFIFIITFLETVKFNIFLIFLL